MRLSSPHSYVSLGSSADNGRKRRSHGQTIRCSCLERAALCVIVRLAVKFPLERAVLIRQIISEEPGGGVLPRKCRCKWTLGIAAGRLPLKARPECVAIVLWPKNQEEWNECSMFPCPGLFNLRRHERGRDFNARGCPIRRYMLKIITLSRDCVGHYCPLYWPSRLAPFLKFKYPAS